MWEPGKTRLAYTAKFLRQIGDYTKDSADRRCTFLGERDSKFIRVRWDDEDVLLENYKDDPEYCAHIRENGSLVLKANMCKKGTVAFVD